MTGSRVVGPALAGLLVITVGFGWAFLVDGLSYIAVLAGLLDDAHVRAVRSPPVGPRRRARSAPGLRYVRAEPRAAACRS